MRSHIAAVVLVACLGTSARAQVSTEPLKEAEEQAQFYEARQRLGDSCADIAELERLAGTVTARTGAMYRAEADLRRQQGIARLRSAMQEFEGWIAASKAQYASAAKKPFSEAVCAAK